MVSQASPKDLDIRARLGDFPVMLKMRTTLDRDGVRIADVACRHPQGRGKAEEAPEHAIVFVRRGHFVRRGEGGEELFDPSSAYCMNPGEEHRYDHPGAGGDDCTTLFLSADLAASLWGGDPMLPSGSLRPSARLDLEQRLLLSEARQGGDPDELAERSLLLAAGMLERSDPRRPASGRPATAQERRRLTDSVREALVVDSGRSLSDLARYLAVSPHHLSRVFRATHGVTISRYRIGLRSRAALERLAAGERNLARLAADLGFADQSHLCRVIRAETGETPSALRRVLVSNPST
jgi:AraC-like DNA-binding protein